jgi:S1-C subfamily serine protease
VASVSGDGEIVTNHHVIQDAHSAIVKLSNGGFFRVDGVLAPQASCGDPVRPSFAGGDSPLEATRKANELPARTGRMLAAPVPDGAFLDQGSV